ncbi:RHS domain-containing protein [Lachnoanaerobaculum gingivalis]|uniref:RHS domain-containing protein n=1 Tax=Lachnoanaerobaculum gingivalis TaxID=2490855 RepID=UPI0038CC0DAE
MIESNARFSDDLCCISFNRHYTYNKAGNKPTTSTATEIGIPRDMTNKDGNLVWFGNYTAWGRLKECN